MIVEIRRGLTTEITLPPRPENHTKRIVLNKGERTVPAHCLIHLPTEIRGSSLLPDDRDLVFTPGRFVPGLGAYGHVVDCHSYFVQLRNDTVKSFNIVRRMRLGTLPSTTKRDATNTKRRSAQETDSTAWIFRTGSRIAKVRGDELFTTCGIITSPSFYVTCVEKICLGMRPLVSPRDGKRSRNGVRLHIVPDVKKKLEKMSSRLSEIRTEEGIQAVP